jgi:two-component system, chemotaxis family, protein-glutamate methylesterase/glutaminase
MSSLLAKTSTLPVKTAIEGGFETGVIYIAPPDVHLVIDRKRMRLVEGPKENLHRPSIDVLFRSAAYAYRTAVIGVVLTGMLDDGTAGLFDVKRHGGITVVQDPRDAEFESMPLNACTHVKVDHLAPLADMPRLLNQLTRNQIAPAPSQPEREELPPITDSSIGSSIRDEDTNAGVPSKCSGRHYSR